MDDLTDICTGIKLRMARMLEEIPSDSYSESKEASSLRDYASALATLERLRQGDRYEQSVWSYGGEHSGIS